MSTTKKSLLKLPIVGLVLASLLFFIFPPIFSIQGQSTGGPTISGPTEVEVGGTVELTASGGQGSPYEWTISPSGAGVLTSSGVGERVSFAAGITPQDVTLTARSLHGGPESSYVLKIVLPGGTGGPPRIKSVSKTRVTQGDEVTFEAEGGNPAGYLWEFQPTNALSAVSASPNGHIITFRVANQTNNIVVSLKDASGAAAADNVLLTIVPKVTPETFGTGSSIDPQAGGTKEFTAIGGFPPYTSWEILPANTGEVDNFPVADKSRAVIRFFVPRTGVEIRVTDSRGVVSDPATGNVLELPPGLGPQLTLSANPSSFSQQGDIVAVTATLTNGQECPRVPTGDPGHRQFFLFTLDGNLAQAGSSSTYQLTTSADSHTVGASVRCSIDSQSATLDPADVTWNVGAQDITISKSTGGGPPPGGNTGGSTCPPGQAPDSSGNCQLTNPAPNQLVNIRSFDVLLQRIVQILLAFAGAIAVIILVICGFRYMASFGNQEAMESAKRCISAAIIGIIIIIMAFAIVSIVNNLVTRGPEAGPPVNTGGNPPGNTGNPPGNTGGPPPLTYNSVAPLGPGLGYECPSFGCDITIGGLQGGTAPYSVSSVSPALPSGLEFRLDPSGSMTVVKIVANAPTVTPTGGPVDFDVIFADSAGHQVMAEFFLTAN